ncbi:MAG: hypothetical protein FWH27_08750 [Planctomycetaceae bacterium]|nr:hypothetical protein [Planctomycetaceae bacterium]
MPPEILATLRNLSEPNPVLVRELKQFVRNRLLLYFMMCYLLLLSLVSIVAMTEPTLLRGWEFLTFDMVSFHGSTGNGLMKLVLLSYYAFTSAFLVLFGAVKMGFERLKNDLGYYTTLPAWRVISGKFLLGAVVSFLFFSIALPFLTIAYMMRGVGIDLLVYSAIYFYLYTLIQYSITLALFSGAKTLRRVYIFALTLLLVQGIAYYIGFGAGSEFLAGNFSRPQDAWPGFCIEAMFIVMPLPLAVCQVSPESANRMLPIRLGKTLMAVLLVLSVFVQFLNVMWSWGYDALQNIFYGLGFFTYFFIPYAILIGICEREQYTIRQRLRIPKSFVGRLLVFPFGTGVFNAIAWFTGYLLFLAGFYLFLDWAGGTIFKLGAIDQDFVEHVLRICVPFSILLFDYAVTAFLLWKIVLHRFISREWLAFSILGLSFGFYLTVIFMKRFSFYSYGTMFEACFFLPIILEPYGRGELLTYQTLLAVIWGIVLLIILTPFWVSAFRRFTRYEGTQLPPTLPEP